MIEYLSTIIIAVCWIHGVEFTFREGEIFGKPGQWMRYRLPEWLLKPTIDCQYCMSSVHGTFIFFLFLHPEFSWHYWPVFCFCVCGFTAIINR